MNLDKEKFHEKFKKEFNLLNPLQKEAVDSIYKSLMVIAGPGTGKTQILALRIGNILLKTDYYPNNILCLTYTDAGAISMRQRLLKLIGPAAYQVKIGTFHSFCNDVIQEFSNEFEKQSLDLISDLEKAEFIRTVIKKLPKNNPLKKYRGDIYSDSKKLLSLFDDIKKENINIRELITEINEYIKNLPFNDEFIYKRKSGAFVKGDLKQTLIDSTTLSCNKLIAALGEYENYNAILSEKGRYDFSDMILWVIKLFQDKPEILMHYQEQYQFILVDEFQDTNGSQNTIINLLANYDDEPNLFVVGDDDQSIYRFQGASLTNMFAFKEKYKPKILVLENNYRSTQPILDNAMQLIENNDVRLVKQIEGLTKNLKASNNQLLNLNTLPVINEFKSEFEELVSVTEQVNYLINEKNIAPKEIAILYKEHEIGEKCIQFFRHKKIPYYVKKDINILDEPFIIKIITILNYLKSEHDYPGSADNKLFEILHYDFFDISSIEISNLFLGLKKANDKIEKENTKSFRTWVNYKINLSVATLFDEDINEAIKNCANNLELLMKDYANETLIGIIEKAIQRMGVLNFILEHENKIYYLQLLSSFFNQVKADAARNPMLTLNNWLDDVELMKSTDIKINLVQIRGSDSGVNLLSLHSSKGLEFEYVFILSVISSKYEKKAKRNYGFKIPDFNIADALIEKQIKLSADFEEARRLFYVGITRAKQGLICSYFTEKNGKNIEKSLFISELENEQIQPINIKINDELLLEYQILEFRELKPEIYKLEKDVINELISKFVMNSTALNNYLNCPLEFFYQNILRIPSGKNENSEFGNAIHYTLDQFFKKKTTNVKVDDKTMIEDFVVYLKKHRESFTEESFNRRKQYGEEILPNYYHKYINEWNFIVSLEKNVTAVTNNGVPIRGKIDKLEFDGNNVTVIDYKTGNVENVIKAKKLSSGGDYWRQAIFYKILLDKQTNNRNWNAQKAIFDFVEPNELKVYKKLEVLITQADIDIVNAEIKEVWDKVQKHDFYTGCGKKDCKWCNLNKNNKKEFALHFGDFEQEFTEYE